MVSTRHNASLTSSEKKRIRDRRAQQNRRDKQESHVKSLEEQVAFCEQHHDAGRIQQLMNSVESLRKENEMLRSRQRGLRQMITSWNADDEAGVSDKRLPHTADQPSSLEPYHPGGELLVPCTRLAGNADVFGQGSPLPSCQLHPKIANIPGTSSAEPHAANLAPDTTSNYLPPPPILSISAEAASSTIPTWCLAPVNEYGYDPSYLPGTCPWLAHPGLIATCPPVPSPLDLLHGTRRNYLADQVHRRIRHRSLRDPECLAMGWLIYTFHKWYLSPNPTTFSRIPLFLRPVMVQLQKGHPCALDLVIWPQMRINLISSWPRYDFIEIMEYMACCVKLRWPWGKDVLERDMDNNLQMRQDFFDIFTQESAWGLTSEFIDKYPELMQGMDIEAIRYRIELPGAATIVA